MHVSAEFLILVGTALVQLAVLLRWIYRRVRDDEIQRAFIRDVAMNHLPHIYSALRQIASQQGLELEESPPVQWADLNGAKRR